MNNTSAQLLTACAQAIVSGDTEAKPDLSSSMRLLTSHAEEAFTFLREEVERLSKRQYSLRPIESAWVAVYTKSIGLHVVRCAFDTPEGTVTDPAPDMLLCIVAPYQRGFYVGAQFAPPEEVAAYRLLQADAARKQQEREELENRKQLIARAFLQRLLRRLYVVATDQPDIYKELESRFGSTDRLSGTEPGIQFDDILFYCVQLGTTPEALLGLPESDS